MWKPSPTQLGATSKLASVLIDYDMARAGRPYSIVHTQTLDGKTEADAVYHDAYAYADGLGRAILTVEQADPGVDLHGYVAKGLTEYDNKGTPRRKYLAWFWDGDPRNYPIGQTPPAGFARQRYDAFGREIQSYALDGTVSIQTEHHALSIDKWDAADLQPGPHAGTYATEQRDGHGRVAALVERIHVSGGVEARATRTDFLPTGEPYRITRTHGRGDDVVRWLRYDTLGRVTLNVEPDTSVGFTADPGADPASLKAWRYAYDDNGDLVGVSDARGCGTDYHYDTAGRVVAEDYSPCLASHAAYSAPDPSSGSGVEVFYQYDAAVPASLGAPGATAGTVAFDACVVDPALQNGRLVVVSDRGSRTINSVDGRGRLACAAKQLARPGASSSDALSSRYAPAWYARTVAYDAADRPVASSTGAKVVVDPATGASVVHTDYTDRGTVRRVSSSYGQKDSSGWADVVQSVSHDADGLAATIVYGDAAHTTTALNHDQRRRLASAQTYRGAAPSWSANPATYAPAPTPAGAPSAFQLLLADVDYLYDAVDNPVEIHDWRTPSEWPAGAQPVTQKVQYDDSYRVTRVDYAYPAGSDAWLDPFAAEAGGSTKDPRRALPSPHLTFGQRPLWETYQYDWLGNTSKTDDDAKGFYDRSLGAIRNGTAGAQPYQIKGAAGGAGLRDGALTTAYDAAGNLAGLSVVRNANAPCAPSGTSCSQRFAYEWDEVGHLSRARRWDGASLGAAGDALPAAPAVAELRFAYDAKDNRVLKTATDARGTSLYTAYVFESLELRRAAFDGTNYQDTVWTEVPYLFSHGVRLARVHYATTDAPTATSGQIHVLMELPDHLGSSTARPASWSSAAPTSRPGSRRATTAPRAGSRSVRTTRSPARRRTSRSASSTSGSGTTRRASVAG
jgi:YD repeat-containing protein